MALSPDKNDEITLDNRDRITKLEGLVEVFVHKMDAVVEKVDRLATAQVTSMATERASSDKKRKMEKVFYPAITTMVGVMTLKVIGVLDRLLSLI